MADTTFTTGTTITSEWLNDVNDAVYNGSLTAEGVQYAPPFTGGVTDTVEAKLAQTVSVKDFGAVGDGVTDDTAAFSAAFSAAANGILEVPDGDYLIDNSANAFAVSNFQGELGFRGNARLVFTTNTKGGIWFTGGTGARISGIRIAYQAPPSVRTSGQEGISFIGMTDVRVTGAYIENSPAAGVLFNECIRPRVSDITIVSSKADGLHFGNCQDPQVVNLITADTGDDGLAFVNYASGTDNTGGTATNIRIRNAKARGISVVGQSDVTISNFDIDGTSASGCYTAYEAAYSTRVPANVVWTGGLVKNAGTVAPLTGNQFGIEYNAVTSVKYSDIRVVSSGNRGMSGAAASGVVEISNVSVVSPAASNGFNISASTMIAKELTAISTPSYGIYVTGCSTLLAQNLNAINCSLTDSLRRAVGFDSNTTIAVDGVNVIDDQVTPTGYNLLITGTQSGWVSNVFANIVNDSFSYTGSFNNVAVPNSRIRALTVNQGFPVGNRLVGYAASAPASGTYAVGDRIYNSTPTVGQTKSWVCTVAGTPGTWVSEGNL